jgi:hypothetical protein
MKNFKHIFKTQLALAFVLLSVNFGFAQVVTVPANCTVVLPGIGGTVGVGGKVGNGGLVSMPDQLLVSPYTPNQGGTFLFNAPLGVTTATWQLKGDLSYKKTTSSVSVNGVTVNGIFNAASNPPAGLTAPIFSYNKTFRPSEYLAPSNKDWARSNGRVTVSWDEDRCGKTIYFDVCKRFVNAAPNSTVPVIVGPNCLKPNTVYTYSVDKIVSDNVNDAIGFDSYYWSGIPAAYYQNNNPDFYTSADGSSITFKTGATVSPITLQCCYGRVNPTTINVDGGPSFFLNTPIGTHTTCVSKSLIVAPVQPSYVTAPPLCVATGTVAAPATFTIVYPNVVLPQVYTWTAPNTGWVDNGTGSATTFTPVVNTTTGNTTLTINTAGNNNPGELTLTITGPCDPVILKYQIERNIIAPMEIVAANGTTTFCLPSTSASNLYTISPTNSNGVTWYLTAVGTAAPLTPITIPGVQLLNSNTQTVTLNTTNAAAGSFLLNVKSSNANCATTFISKVINIKPAAPTFNATTPSCLTKSATTQVTTVSVSPVGGTGTYTWTLPAGVSFANATAPSNTSSNPTLIFNGTGTSSNLSVTATGTNGCNSSAVSKVINYVGVQPNFLAGFPDQYLVNPTCNNVLSWQITAGGVTTNYQAPFPTTGTVTISNSPANAGLGIPQGVNNILTLSGSGTTVTAVCATLVGGTQVCATSIGTYTQRQAVSNIVNDDTIKNVTISPNPNNGNFVIKVTDFEISANAVLTDFSGNQIQTYSLQKGDNKIEKEGLEKGIYFVVLRVDGKQETRKIIIK